MKKRLFLDKDKVLVEFHSVLDKMKKPRISTGQGGLVTKTV